MGDQFGLVDCTSALPANVLDGRFEIADADHALSFDIPNLQTQTADNIHRIKRGGFGMPQLGQRSHDLRQAVEGNAGIQMMNVMIADIGREPGPDGAGFQVTGGFQRGFVVSPAGIVVKRHAGEIVLGVKQIGSDGVGDEEGNGQGQQQRQPAKEISDQHAQCARCSTKAIRQS